MTYYIKKNARWSDGKPITAQDYRFTWQTIMNKSFNILSTIGYEDISSARVINSKTIQFRFKKIYAGVDMFSEILPSTHSAARTSTRSGGTTSTTRRRTARSPAIRSCSSRGTAAWNMTFVRNERYWGPKAYLSRIIFRFVPDTNTQVQQIRGGEPRHPEPAAAAFVHGASRRPTAHADQPRPVVGEGRLQLPLDRAPARSPEVLP